MVELLRPQIVVTLWSSLFLKDLSTTKINDVTIFYVNCLFLCILTLYVLTVARVFIHFSRRLCLVLSRKRNCHFGGGPSKRRRISRPKAGKKWPLKQKSDRRDRSRSRRSKQGHLKWQRALQVKRLRRGPRRNPLKPGCNRPREKMTTVPLLPRTMQTLSTPKGRQMKCQVYTDSPILQVQLVNFFSIMFVVQILIYVIIVATVTVPAVWHDILVYEAHCYLLKTFVEKEYSTSTCIQNFRKRYSITGLGKCDVRW